MLEFISVWNRLSGFFWTSVSLALLKITDQLFCSMSVNLDLFPLRLDLVHSRKSLKSQK